MIGRDYPVETFIEAEDGDRFVLFSSERTGADPDSSIFTREVFRIGSDGEAVWQISPEVGCSDSYTKLFSSTKQNKYDFIWIRLTDNQLYAIRYNGDTFLVDQVTGTALFHHWEKI